MTVKIGVYALSDEEALLAGDGLLLHVGLLSLALSGGSTLASRAADKLPAAIAAAQADQVPLASSVANVAAILAKYKDKRRAARAAEKTLDSAFAALRALLSVAVKGGSAEAAALDAFLFPGGSSPVTALQGRPQQAKYQAWFLLADHATARENPAYSAIAAAVEDLRPRLAAFAALLDEAETLDADLKRARAARRQARTTWNASVAELITLAAQAYGETSDAFTLWIKPITDIKADQAAEQTRKANAAAASGRSASAGPASDPPAAVVVTEEGGG